MGVAMTSSPRAWVPASSDCGPADAFHLTGIALAIALVLMGATFNAEAAQEEALQVVEANVATPDFDVALTSELVLGRAWRRARNGQRARFQDVFTAVMLKAYADALAITASNAQLHWTRASLTTLPGSTAVAAAIEGEGVAPLRMIFAMRQDDAGVWRVYDVSFNGLSLVEWFRGPFAASANAGAIETAIAQVSTMQRPFAARAFAQAGG